MDVRHRADPGGTMLGSCRQKMIIAWARVIMMELMELVEVKDSGEMYHEIWSRFRNGCIMGMMNMEVLFKFVFGFLNFLNSKTIDWNGEMRGVSKILRSFLGMMGMKCFWNLQVKMQNCRKGWRFETDSLGLRRGWPEILSGWLSNLREPKRGVITNLHWC